MKIQKAAVAALACLVLAGCESISDGIDNFVDAFVDASQPGSAYNNPNYNPDAGQIYSSGGGGVCVTGYPYVACNGFVSCTATPLPAPSCSATSNTQPSTTPSTTTNGSSTASCAKMPSNGGPGACPM